MRFALRILGIASCLAAAGNVATARAGQTSPCLSLTDAGRTYSVCTFDLRRYFLRLFWRDKSGIPYGNVANLVAALSGAKSAPVFAMNAGMYRPDLSPAGLYVEHGVQLNPANLADGSGNFHLKPNGVFYVHATEAGVLETSAYLGRNIMPDLATQSGPMLVIGGKLHPKFRPSSDSRKIRNGVGVRDGHIVVFAISSDGVTFTEFANLFRRTLACPDALFLDGTISSLYAPSLRRSESLLPAGPMLAAFETDK